MENKIIWLIDDLLLERHNYAGFPDFAQAARELGHEVIMKRYIPFSNEIDYPPEFYEKYEYQPIVAYGCVGFMKQLQRIGWWKNVCPGSYLKQDELKFSKSAAMWGDYMLNERFIMLPYAEVSRRIKWDTEKGGFPQFFNSPHLFLRPDAVTKSFVGRVLDFMSLEDNIDALNKYEKISPDEIVIVADDISEYIQAEFRHFIVGNEVVTSSQYMRDGKFDIRVDVDEDCLSLARAVASKHNPYQWEPDYVYVVDTALTPDGPRIIEFNSFSCSGLYACNSYAIIEAVSRQAWKEFRGEP